MKKIFIFYIIFILLIITNTFSQEIYIKLKINNQIITNIDIDNEKKYLAFFNPDVKQIPEDKMEILSTNSLVREKIKTEEVKKFFDIKKEYDFLKKIENNILNQKKFKDKSELKKYLISIDLDYKTLMDKIKLESLWNQIIYNKYKNNIKIDEKYLKQRILIAYEKSDKKYEYNLSEIVIEKLSKDEIKKKYDDIKKSVKEVGFQNTANLFGISNSAKIGGKIGWIKESQLSEKILNSIKKTNIGSITEEIEVAAGYLILQINDKREIQGNLEIKKELKNLIEFEKNRQLNLYSLLYYKRLKQNASINEYR
tara:strand:+ start:5564 stop:6496 length:933 start_codon:yes stop_codon:yes gene_type:complete